MTEAFDFDPTAPTLPTPRKGPTGAVDLSLSLDDIVSTKREERRQERLEKKKAAQAQKKDAPTKKNKKPETKKDDKKKNGEKKADKADKKKKSLKEERPAREGPKSFQINVSEDVLRSILEKAGVDTRNYTVSLHAVPKDRHA